MTLRGPSVALLISGVVLLAGPLGSVAQSGSPPAEVATEIADFAFAPSIDVGTGGTVTWRNDDPVDHTVTASDGSFSAVLPAGGSFTHIFSAPGSVAYFCAIHPSMTGTVNVVRAQAIPAERA